MKYLLYLLLIGIGIQACRSTDEFSVDHYYTNTERDTLLTGIVQYVDYVARGATIENRLEPRFRALYATRLPKYAIDRYFIAPDSTHYFFVTRPGGQNPLYKRGVGGKLRVDAKGRITEFEELYNTPRLKDFDELKKRGRYIFGEMVKRGNVDDLVQMKLYIEWPDSMLVYDRKQHWWVATPKAKGVF
jgi:hypothetical protein